MCRLCERKRQCEGQCCCVCRLCERKSEHRVGMCVGYVKGRDRV